MVNGGGEKLQTSDAQTLCFRTTVGTDSCNAVKGNDYHQCSALAFQLERRTIVWGKEVMYALDESKPIAPPRRNIKSIHRRCTSFEATRN